MDEKEYGFELHQNAFEVPLDRIDANPWNPNEQDEKMFNALCQNIEEVGMVEPILISPKEDGRFQIVSGEHRFEAYKVLGFDTIPAYIRDIDDEMQKFQTIRMNVIKGRLSPQKFTSMFNDMAEKYGEELTKQMMMFVDDNAFESVYQGVKRELPQELQDKMDETKEEIKTIDDLSRVLNELFSTYGDTLDQNFMVFTYGGRTHLWVSMSESVKKKMMDDIVYKLNEQGIDINIFFNELLVQHADDIFKKVMDDNSELN